MRLHHSFLILFMVDQYRLYVPFDALWSAAGPTHTTGGGGSNVASCDVWRLDDAKLAEPFLWQATMSGFLLYLHAVPPGNDIGSA